MQRNNDTLIGIVVALCLHGLVVFLFVLSSLFSMAVVEPEAKGEPVQASVMISAADIKLAQKSIRESVAAPPPKPAQASQPTPEPNPQTADTPQQTQAQAPVIQPDSVDQNAISKSAIEQTQEQIAAEREARRQQAQIDLTDDVKKQEMAENKQRLREKVQAELDALQFAKSAAAKRTRQEEQKEQQLADLRQAFPMSAPSKTSQVQAPVGNPNANSDLEARYIAAIKATIQSNWRHDGAQPLERCQVEFTQAPGGLVLEVIFISCPFSPEGRASAERAVTLTPLPYSGFETVFKRRQKFTLCYPTEQCEK